jgi:hypothetical protein
MHTTGDAIVHNLADARKAAEHRREAAKAQARAREFLAKAYDDGFPTSTLIGIASAFENLAQHHRDAADKLAGRTA